MKHFFAIFALTLSGALVGCATGTSSDGPPDPLFAKVTGTWGDIGESEFSCHSGPHTITFSKNYEKAVFRVPRPMTMADGTVRQEITYKVLKVEGNIMTLFAEAETRKTRSGDPVVWSLVLVGDDEYYWRRTDWAPGSSTPRIRRCERS